MSVKQPFVVSRSLNAGIQPLAKSSLEIREWVRPEDSFLGWQLAGHGEAYSNCGSFWTKGCLNVGAHKDAQLDDPNFRGGKAYIKVLRRTCARGECPVCYKTWASKEAHKIEYRLKEWRSRGRPIHLIVSPSKNDWFLNTGEMRTRAYLNAKRCGFLGGSCIFHAFREDRLTKRWYFSPHFHMIGYGWIQHTLSNFEKNGWIVKNIGIRKSVHSTALYQLSHATIHSNRHTITWFGRLSYNKLRVRPEKPKEDRCPICNSKLVSVRWLGKGECPVPMDREGVYFVDPIGWWRWKWRT